MHRIAQLGFQPPRLLQHHPSRTELSAALGSLKPCGRNCQPLEQALELSIFNHLPSSTTPSWKCVALSPSPIL